MRTRKQESDRAYRERNRKLLAVKSRAYRQLKRQQVEAASDLFCLWYRGLTVSDLRDIRAVLEGEDVGGKWQAWHDRLNDECRRVAWVLFFKVMEKMA